MKQLRFFLLMTLMCSFSTIFAASIKVGIQAYTFRAQTFEEVLENCKDLGLRHLEIYLDQPLGKSFGDKKISLDMDAQTHLKIKDALKKSKMKIVACGVVKPESESEWRKIFDLASKLGIETITCEPMKEHLDLLEGLCEQYKIDIAIHNSMKPSLYWNPDSVMKLIDTRSKRIGICADLGHWTREDVDVIQALKKSASRLKVVHLKDVTERRLTGSDQKDAVLGTGVIPIDQVLRELAESKYKGCYTIEMLLEKDDINADIAKSLEYLERQIRRLGL